MYSKNYKTFFLMITISANLSGFYMGFQMLLLNALASEFGYLHGKGTWFSVYTSFFAFGGLIGWILCYKLMQKIGRYYCILLQNIIGTFGALLSFFIYHTYVFVIGRALCGISWGFIPFSSLFYIKEIIPSAYSSRYLSSFHLFLLCGNICPWIIVPLCSDTITISLTTVIPILMNGV